MLALQKLYNLLHTEHLVQPSLVWMNLREKRPFPYTDISWLWTENLFLEGRKLVAKFGEYSEYHEFIIEQQVGNRKQNCVSKFKGIFGKFILVLKTLIIILKIIHDSAFF